MRTWTARRFAPLFALVGVAGCNVSINKPSDDGGPEPTPVTCEKQLLPASASFERTAGPDLARFQFVAATHANVFASTGESLHRSTDEGATWSIVDADMFRGARIAALMAVNDSVFVSIEGEAGGIFRSTDGGSTWTDLSTADVPFASHLSTHGDSVFAVANAQIFRFDDALATWDPLPVSDLAFDVAGSDGTYVYANSLYMPGVYRVPLDVADATWTQVIDLPEWGYRAFAFDEDHGFAANADGVFETHDGGATWKSAGESPQVEDILLDGANVFTATSTGLRVSTDGGTTWKSLGANPFVSHASLASNGAHLFTAGGDLERALPADALAGSWERLHPIGDAISGLASTGGSVLSLSDGRLLRTTDGGVSWSPIDGEWFASLTVHEGAVYAMSNQSVMQSTDDGASFHVQSAAPGDGAGVNFLASTPNGLVAGVLQGAGAGCSDVSDITTTLYRSIDGGATWKPAMNGFPTTFTDCYGYTYGPGLTGIADVGGVLFATGYWKGTYRSIDGGAKWTAIATPESMGLLSAFAPVEGGVVAIASKGGIVRSTDAGVTWTPAGLDSLGVYSLLEHEGALYASVASVNAADAGVYSSSDGGQTWSRIDASFDARATFLAIQGDALFAGTLDQSVWSAPLACSAD